MEPQPAATVIKLDHRGREMWRYQGQLLQREPGSITIEARFNTPDKDLPGLRLRTGDRFVEHHYADRWYNVFAIYDGTSGAFKGWYCNITRPARIEGNQVSAEDLALDLVVQPDGSWMVLDREEFEGLGLTESDRAGALAALAELQELARRKTGPFRPT